jgi:hypothetical protein
MSMNGPEDFSFDVEGRNGPLRVVISTSVLRSFAGRSHVTVSEVLEIYRSDLEDVARAKARKNGSLVTVRLEASDL